MTQTFKYFNGFWSTAVIMLIDQILLSLASGSLFRLVLNDFLRTLILFVHFLAPQAFFYHIHHQTMVIMGQYIISLQGRNGDIQIVEN